MYSDKNEVRTHSTVIEVKDGKLDKATEGTTKDVFRRVFSRGRWGYGKNVPLSSINLRFLQKKDYELSGFEAGKSKNTKVGKDPLDFSIGEKNNLVFDIGRRLKDMEKKGKYSITYFDSVSKNSFESSEGISLEKGITRCGIFISCILKKGRKLESAFYTMRDNSGLEVLDDMDLKEPVQTARELLRARQVRGGEYDVIMDPRLTGTFVHESIGHMCEGDMIATKDSILSGKKGEKIGSDLVTIKDSPINYGEIFFDRDGVKKKSTTILKRGVLEGFMNSRDSAGQLGEISTGNCRGAYGNVRMCCTFMEGGRDRLPDLLDIKEGIYLKGMKGGTAEPSTGLFNFTPVIGYLIRDGEIIHPLKNMALLGNSLETLKNIDSVSKDVIFRQSHCGKSGEWAPVSAGGPHIRTRCLVGGSA